MFSDPNDQLGQAQEQPLFIIMLAQLFCHLRLFPKVDRLVLFPQYLNPLT